MRVIRKIELNQEEKEMLVKVIDWFDENAYDLERIGINTDRDLYEIITDILNEEY